MRGQSRIVGFKNSSPVETVVTAIRDTSPGKTGNLETEDRKSGRENLLRRLLQGTGIPPDGWTVTSEPDILPVQCGYESNAALAAILRAGVATPLSGVREDTIFSGTWTAKQPFRLRGGAVEAKYASRSNRIFVGVEDGRLNGVLPRNGDLLYQNAAAIGELLDVMAGKRDLIQHRAEQPEAEPEIDDLTNLENILDTHDSLTSHLIPAIEIAYRERRPLRVLARDTNPLSITATTYATKRLLGFSAMIMPALTADEEQAVLETYDLLGLNPPRNAAQRVIRPGRAPHPSVHEHALRPMRCKRLEDKPGRPGELDLAARGTLVTNISAENRMDGSASSVLVDDMSRRTTDRYLLIAVNDTTETPRDRNSDGRHPLTALPYVTATVPSWTRKTVDRIERARLINHNRRLLADARRRLRQQPG